MQLGVTIPLLRLVAKPTKPEILRTWLTFFHFKCLCTDYFINAQVMKGAHYSNSYYLVLTLERISWEVQIWIKNTNLSFLEVIFQILMFEERSITVLIIWFVKLMGLQGLCLGGKEIIIWIYVMCGTPFCGASTLLTKKITVQSFLLLSQALPTTSWALYHIWKLLSAHFACITSHHISNRCSYGLLSIYSRLSTVV